MTKARIRQIRAFAALAPESDESKMLTELVEEIEALQRFTRRGEKPTEPNPPRAGHLPKETKERLTKFAADCNENAGFQALDVPTNPKKKARGTQDEFETFAESLGLPASDGEFFFFKLVASDWKISGKPVKDWRASVRSWKAGKYLPSQKPTNAKPPAEQGPAFCRL